MSADRNPEEVGLAPSSAGILQCHVGGGTPSQPNEQNRCVLNRRTPVRRARPQRPPSLRRRYPKGGRRLRLERPAAHRPASPSVRSRSVDVPPGRLQHPGRSKAVLWRRTTAEPRRQPDFRPQRARRPRGRERFSRMQAGCVHSPVSSGDRVRPQRSATSGVGGSSWPPACPRMVREVARVAAANHLGLRRSSPGPARRAVSGAPCYRTQTRCPPCRGCGQPAASRAGKRS